MEKSKTSNRYSPEMWALPFAWFWSITVSGAPITP